MILLGQLTPQKLQRIFNCSTRISIQVTGAATITISKDQGEASNPGDGVQLTQGNTSSPEKPYETWVKGDLWYRASAPNTPFVLLILVEGQ